MIDAALKLVAKGWAVFPLRPGTKLPATMHGCKDATRDAQVLQRLWIPDANIGIATGSPSGIWVLDVDSEVGLEHVLEFSDGQWPDTLTQRTPSGGYHFIFRNPGGLGNTARKFGPDLDSRGDGGYIVVAPSVTEKGCYEWLARREPAAIPGWLLRLVKATPEVRKVEVKPVPERNLNRYVEKALDNECAELAAMPANSGRNHALNSAAFSLGQLVGAGRLDSGTVYARLLNACVSNGLLAEDGDRKCRGSIASGLTDGIANPRQVPA